MTTCRFHVPRRQRGVIGLLGAMVMTLVVVCTALALDTGRLYMEKRNLQRVADLAALSVASRCEYLSACEKAVEYAQDVLADNGYSRELVDSDGITLGRVTLEDVAAEGGTAYRLYGFESASHAQDAVEVVLDRTVSPPLMAALMPDDSSTTLQSTAVARKTNYVAFSVGSRLASLDTSSSPLLAPILGGLLGSEVPLSLVGYEGVLDTQVTLLELASEMPGLGVDLAALTIDEVLNTSVSVSQLLEASERVLSDSGVLASDLTLLNEMENALSLDVGSTDIRLGRLFDMQVADGGENAEALKTGVRLGDLLGTSLLLANRDNAISLENLAVDVPGVTADVSLAVTEAPQLAVGPVGCMDGEACDGSNWITTGKTAQLDLDAVFHVNLLNVLELDLSLNDMTASQAEAGVESIAVSDAGYDIDVGAVPHPVEVGYMELTVEVLEEFDGLINVGLNNASNNDAVFGDSSSHEEQTITGWPDERETTFESGVSGVTMAINNLLANLEFDVSLGPESEDCSGLLCSLASELLDPVNDLLDGVVESVTDLESALGTALGKLVTPLVAEVIDPLLGTAGLGVGEAEVRVIEVSSSGVELVQ